MSSPLLVGITGGIGSGKSTACRIFEVLGVPIYYADDKGKFLLVTNHQLIQTVKSEFGAQSYSPNGQLNRSYLAEVVFSDPVKLERLNALVHPAVSDDFKAWVASHQDFPYLIKEAALLIETGSYKLLDEVICVYASEQIRTERVLLRDPQRSPQQVAHIMEQQTTDNVRKENCRYSIVNDAERLLIPQVLKIHEKILTSTSN